MDFLNKKGILITFLSLLVASFFILVFSARIDVPVDSQTDLISFKVTIIERFTETWEDYTEKSLNAAAYRALIQMTEFIQTNGLFLSEADFITEFYNCMMNGTVGTQNCSGDGNRNNLTIPFFLDTLSDVALNNLSINITYNITSIDVFQDHPFFITIDLNMSYQINDRFAIVAKNVTISKLVTLEGVKDPLLAVMSAFSNKRKIKATATKASEWNLGNLTDFINNREYRFHRNAPSFMNRMWEDLSGSQCCGIEAVLSRSVDGFSGPVPGFLYNASYVDHYFYADYFSGSGSLYLCDEVYWITGLPALQMDQQRLASFNITTDLWNSILPCPNPNP